MCADLSMLFGILLFFVAASPSVIIAAIVHVCRKNKTDEIVWLLD
jgi:hypothetical protein